MNSVRETRRKRKDRERKSALIPCGCHLCRGKLCSAKKARRHKTIFQRGAESSEESSGDDACSSNLSQLNQYPVDLVLDAGVKSSREFSDDNDNSNSSFSQPSLVSHAVVKSSGESSDDHDGNESSNSSSFSNEESPIAMSGSMSDLDLELECEISHEGHDEVHHDFSNADFPSAVWSDESSSVTSGDASCDQENVVEEDSDSPDELDHATALPLYEGSNKTVMEVLAGYFHWFSRHPSISKSALSSLLAHEHCNVLPKGNNLPSSYDQAYNFVKPNLLPTECYHACPNDCILFRKTDRYNYTKLKKCPKCSESRYAANGQPRRRFLYYPLGPRWRRLFECKETSKMLQEHALRPDMGDLMTDIFDSPKWKAAYAPDGLFQGDPRGLSVQLSTDGVNPFSANKICYSMWPIMLSVLNWPKVCRNLFENVMLVGVIPANGKGEAKSVDPYLEVVVDEIMTLSENLFYDGYKDEQFCFRVHLHNYVLDYPGLNKVFCCTGAGALQGCMWCESIGTHNAVLDKVVYLNNRCFLPPTHPLRKAKKTFPSRKAEHRPPPERLTQEEVMVNSLAYEKAKNPTQAAGFATATGSKGCYCLMLLPDHDRTEQVYPDTMHLIKNVTSEMVQLLTGYKDSQKVRKAEQQLGRFQSSWIQEDQEKSSEESSKRGKRGKKKEKLPDAPFRLTSDELKVADKRAGNVQVPVGYGWSPRPLFAKYSYMKSHDWKQLVTDGILKFCFRKPLLGKSQRVTLFKLFDLLSALCDDIQEGARVLELEEEANVVLSLIERDFPISVQTISMHMVRHIARGIASHGPVHSWWMYVYERMNSWICRRVTNRRHPEANVMETYRIFDWCQYMRVTGKLPANNPEQSISKKAEPEQEFQESCHRRMDDPITGKTLTWVTTGKENTGTLSSIVAVQSVSDVKFGKVLKFTCQKVEDKFVESACVHAFSHLNEDEDSGLWWVNTSIFTEKLVPLCDISKPLVTAKDDDDKNKLWILNYRRSRYM